ncbi:hypothetical protein I7I50_08137 [Histoplasma capsulatum G186AR]|uniref:Uncharacterized protein n=1 Tax=Ajellomyces capsulatus TaxID=5037 RepID=A0A8H7YH28_AJECA|nr:hypothetical protein I7I52_08653 [Histoplasma capsulatum]QSS68655.1 hypothetical protein I7I50_08137 [Histoplasma capsulatum G186AR]
MCHPRPISYASLPLWHHTQVEQATFPFYRFHNSGFWLLIRWLWKTGAYPSHTLFNGFFCFLFDQRGRITSPS